MARVLTCIDPTPASDGSCAQSAWVDQATWIDYLPTVEQANTVGFAIFCALAMLAAFRLINPRESDDT